MAELTREHLDQQIKKLATNKELDEKLAKQTKELKSYTDQQTEKLATIVNTAFQEQKDHMNQRFDKVDDRFDNVEERLGVVEIKLDRALYIETTHLEARLTRIEHHVGLKPPKVPAGHKT